MPMKNPRLLFLIRFLSVSVVLYAIIAIRPVNDAVVVPFTAGIASVSGAALNLIGYEVVVTDRIIRRERVAVEVNNGCNGLEGIALLIAAMVAFPASFRNRLIGIVIGTLVIQLVNIVRVAMLVWLRASHPEAFQLFHIGVFQTLIVLLAFGLFMIWSAKLASPRAVAANR